MIQNRHYCREKLKMKIKDLNTFYNHNRLHASLNYDKVMNLYLYAMKQAA